MISNQGLPCIFACNLYRALGAMVRPTSEPSMLLKSPTPSKGWPPPAIRSDAPFDTTVRSSTRPSATSSTSRHGQDTTLAEEIHLQDATEDELDAAMDWLLERQKAIKTKLARRPLSDGGLDLYDVSSSYNESDMRPLAEETTRVARRRSHGPGGYAKREVRVERGRNVGLSCFVGSAVRTVFDPRAYNRRVRSADPTKYGVRDAKHVQNPVKATTNGSHLSLFLIPLRSAL